jgi:hypothetical protein
VVIAQLEEEPELGDCDAVEAGRRDIERGKFTPFKDWRNEMGLYRDV